MHLRTLIKKEATLIKRRLRPHIFRILSLLSLCALTACSTPPQEASIPSKYLGEWSAYSRNHVSICGNMTVKESPLYFSRMGPIPFEILEIRPHEIYLQLLPENGEREVLRLGPISKSKWESNHEDLTVAFYDTQQMALKPRNSEIAHCNSWGKYTRKTERKP